MCRGYNHEHHRSSPTAGTPPRWRSTSARTASARRASASSVPRVSPPQLWVCLGAPLARLARLRRLRPCAPLLPPAPPLGPFPTLCNPSRPSQPACNPSRPLTPPHDPFRPPYRPKALDCHALEQAIGEGKAAELPAEDLKAAEAVLEKARAAEKAKCEKDLRDKMKARSLSGLTSPDSPHYSAPRPLTSGLTSHAPAHSPCPRLNSFSYPSLHAPPALTAPALAPNTAPTTGPQATHYSAPSPLTTEPPVPLLPFRRRGRCWASTSRASARRSHAPSSSGCPASYSSRPRPSCPKRRGRTSSRERARHLARSLARSLAEISRGQGTPVRAAWRAHARGRPHEACRMFSLFTGRASSRR